MFLCAAQASTVGWNVDLLASDPPTITSEAAKFVRAHLQLQLYLLLFVALCCLEAIVSLGCCAGGYEACAAGHH